VPKRYRNPQTDLERGLVAATIARYPREFVGVVMATAATIAIFVNALFMQNGPHPAPIFATRPFVKHHTPVVLPRPQPKLSAPPTAAARSQAEIVSDIQRALAARGFYQGAVDGIWGAKSDAAVRAFEQAIGRKTDPAPSEILLHAITASHVKAAVPHTPSAAVPEPPPAPAHTDTIATLIDPPHRVLEIQHALADFGYGQIKPTGIVDADTRAAIETFERERHLAFDGRISPRFVRELAAMTGRSLE
jgi:peptidoglycan hydrolase-like protein with peptidoglycan-binding domain